MQLPVIRIGFALPATVLCALALGVSSAQQPAAAPAEPAPVAASTPQPVSGVISEEELKRLLVGKTFYLRGGYLDNALSFDEHGGLAGHSPQGSYTLSLIEIGRVRLSKHKVELEGVRYGMHFLGALPYEDPSKAVDRVRITPNKKVIRITIDREVVVKPKKGKHKEKDEAAAAAPAEEPPANPGKATTTTSPEHAWRILVAALDAVFAPSLDARMMDAMPDFWKLYYQAAADKTDYRPSDPSVLRQGEVDTKARLTTPFEPESNEYAQQAGVAGMALYHAVIGADGKPAEIAVARPIGFGLDENAVAAIRGAKFEPAMKDGKAVPVLLDLVVQFRIFSKRTAAASAPAADQPAAPALPGPYSVKAGIKD